MGSRNGPNNADFPVGTRVRIKGNETLIQFSRPQWKFHHPVEEVQMSFAGKLAVVTNAGYYHGGDELYVLEGIPGTWHEKCLELA
jgi:hypothetical protein